MLQEGNNMLLVRKMAIPFPQIPKVVDRRRAVRKKWQGELRHAAKLSAAKRLAAKTKAGRQPEQKPAA
jgi:hypothetical protein